MTSSASRQAQAVSGRSPAAPVLLSSSCSASRSWYHPAGPQSVPPSASVPSSSIADGSWIWAQNPAISRSAVSSDVAYPSSSSIEATLMSSRPLRVPSSMNVPMASVMTALSAVAIISSISDRPSTGRLPAII
jgi:hypothetical protein